ncbi:MAG: 50S ribosomal protein L10 [Conexivisphaerales archaeon]
MSNESILVRNYPERKVRQFKKIVDLASKYSVIAIASLNKVRSTQIMEIRKSMRGQLELLVVKNKIALKSLSNLNRSGLSKLFNYIKGQNLYIFTNMNPFKLNLTLEKNKVLLPAKGGDIATEPIIIPAGNTGLAPGPVLSEFKDSKVITKIEGGSIWVTKDTVVAEPGEVISPKLASLLSKLGIKPIKAGLTIDVVYWDGLLLLGKDLQINIEDYKNQINAAYLQSFNLALKAGYPASKEVTEALIVEAYTKALNVAKQSNYLTKESAKLILSSAEISALNTLELLKRKGYNF